MTTIPESIVVAWQYLEAGHLLQAQEICRQILQRQPYDIDALQILGITAARSGQYEVAIDCFAKAVSVEPEVADFHYNLGKALQDAGELEQAIAYYEQALSLDREHVGAYNDLGRALQAKGQLARATACYQQALILEPNRAELHNRLGAVLQEQGLLAEAITYYRKALTIRPSYVEVHSNLGSVLQQQGRLEEAISCYVQALKLKPRAEVYSNLGNVLQQQGRLEEAIACYQQALALKPDSVRDYINLGGALQEFNQLDLAINCYQKALIIQPNSVEIYSNLGSALQQQGNFKAAIDCYEKALTLSPERPELYSNLGSLLEDIGKLESAIAYYDRALAIKPNYVIAENNLAHAFLFQGKREKALAYLQPNRRLTPEERFSRAYLLLLAGDLQRGFNEYECRWECKETPPRPFTQPIWDGSPLNDRTILLHAEQGLGDSLQFIRYVYLVANYGDRIIVECQSPLVRLFETIPCINRVIERNTELPDFDIHAPLMSLPRILGTTLETVPAEIPYLTAPKSSIKLEAASETIKVGIVWSSGSGGKTSQRRSLPLPLFLELTKIPGITFYNLQKDASETDITQLETAGIQNLSHLLNDFTDTAAIIEQLDLLVSVDTSVAHLAGALGKPVWMLLPFDPDWRWLLFRENSPWYPTMKLFRQKHAGEWKETIASVTRALENLFRVMMHP